MALRELFAVFGVDFETKALNQGSASLDVIEGNLRKFGEIVASAWITRGVYDLAVGVADFADELTDAGDAIGLSAKDLLVWRTTAASVGVGAEQLRSVFGAFARNVDGAKNGAKEAKKGFADLGVALDNGAGGYRDTNALLVDAAAALARIEDPTARAALAQRLLGEQGARLLPAFQDGAAGLEAMRAEVELLFGGSLEDAAKQADDLERQTALFDLSLAALKTTIGLELLPTVIDFVSSGKDLVKFFQEATKGTHILEAAMVVLGVAALQAGVRMIVPFLPALATFALIAAALGIVILVVDDLITMFSGGQSVIGEFIDSMWGVGTTKEGVEDLKDAWAGLNLALSDGWNWIKDIGRAIFEPIGNFVVWADKIDLVSGALETAGRIWRDIKRDLADVEEFLDPLTDVLDPLGAKREEIEANGGRLPESNDREQRMRRFAQYGQALGGARTAPLPGSAGGRQVTQNINQRNPVTIQVVSSSSDPQEVASAVESRLQESQSRQYSDARNALVSTAD